MSRLRGLLVSISIGLLVASCGKSHGPLKDPAEQNAPVVRRDSAPAPVGVKFSPAQTAEIRSIIKGYLMEHPEVLRDAITELDNKEKAAEADARRKAISELKGQLFNAPDGFVIGNPDGKITLVEFFDYNCGFCKKALPDMARLIKDNKDLKIVLRDFPILSPQSVDAALVAAAVHNQFTGEKYWDFHRKLLSQRGVVGKDQALSVAKEMGADMAKLNDDATSPATRKAVQASDALAKGLSLNGTPTYVVGDDVLVGAVGFEKIGQAIGNVRKCGKSVCS